MAVILSTYDLDPFADIEPAKATAMVEDALALAARVAPCLADTDDESVVAAARAVLRGAVLRWHESGAGAFQAQSAGPFGVTMDTRQQRRGMFWPAEIEALQDLCSTGGGNGVFAVDTVGTGGAISHADICALNFGAAYCSCGASLTQSLPLYEV